MNKEMTKELARERFLALVRGVAATWAGYELPNEAERCDGVVFGVLNIIDGNSGVLPALNLVLCPHPDDKAFNLKGGDNYYPAGLVINDDCALHELLQNPPEELLPEEHGVPRAYTKVEVREQLLDKMREYAHAWATIPEKTAEERCNGLCFSLMNIFDGTSVGIPAFNLVTRPQPDAKAYDISHGRDHFAAGMAINDDVMLHDMYYE